MSGLTRGSPCHRETRASIEVVGVVMAVIVFLAAGTSFALQVPPFNGTDERAHLAYAHAIADGHLPTIEERPDVPGAATQWRHELIHDSDSDSYRTIWVANHPPLHYMLVAPLVWASMDRADGGLLFLRLANLAFASIGIVFTYLLTTEVTGSRRLGLGAAALAATSACGHYEFAHALNDGLAFAATTAVMWATARVLRRGPSRRDLLIVAATVAVAAGARAASMVVAIVAVGVLAVAELCRAGRPLARRARAAVVTAVVTLLPATIVFGWFYIRNVVLYGDIGGSAYLMDHFDRHPSGGFIASLANGRMWMNIYSALSTRSAPGGETTPAAAIVVAIASIAALAGIATIAVRRPRTARSPSARSVSRAALAACAVAVLVVAVTIVQHVSAGGLPWSRYALPALGVLACLFTAGVDVVLPRVLVLVAIGTATVWTAHFLPSRVATEIAAGDRTPEHLPAALSALLLAVSVGAAVVMLAVLTVSSTRREPSAVISSERPTFREMAIHVPVGTGWMSPILDGTGSRD